MSGFLGKIALTEAGVRVGTPLAYAVVAAGMLTSLLTLYAVAKAWNLAFWRTPEQAHEMAMELSDPGRWSRSQHVIQHRDHVHLGTGTFGARDQVEARSILDEEDGTNQDLHQLIEAGSLPSRLPRSMVGATAGLVACSLGLSVFAGPVFGYTSRAAHDILDPTVYISSVLSQGSR
jgi:multicomponent Na+:H+ antiporter subunit D